MNLGFNPCPVDRLSRGRLKTPICSRLMPHTFSEPASKALKVKQPDAAFGARRGHFRLRWEQHRFGDPAPHVVQMRHSSPKPTGANDLKNRGNLAVFLFQLLHFGQALQVAFIVGEACLQIDGD
jgi:hypothetical protein